ncbi:MAG: L-aspartate oxidase [Clostridia bacterium]|nr:L-aspartate oxidase [Clostridia bacterium]MBR2877512.1 L-aspartate oxidase [Clostridia bacterium]
MREYAFGGSLDELDVINYDVIIAGMGIAGLYAALNLDERLSCALINKAGEDSCNSVYAQGGVAAVTQETDTWQSHFEDTLTAGAGMCDEKAVEVLVKEGPSDIAKLMELGVPFDRDENGNLSITTEGAHKCKRILHCGGDATGLHITETLVARAKERENTTIYNNTMIIDILTNEEGKVSGVIAKTGKKYVILRSSYVIIASGGIGRVYRNSTNASTATGDGIAAAYRAGAYLTNMEFVQFHPTALIHPDKNMRHFLISEALRGEGAILRNRKSEPIMEGAHPMKDLAPRDIVARAIVSEMRKHDVPNVYLDITAKPRDFLKKRFPSIYKECMSRGIDIAVNWIPVVPVQHYFMGGIKTDTNARTNIEGLYACGESACTGVHGANRLASNSLLECLVFGRHAAEDINASFAGGKRKNELLCDNTKRSVDIDFETCRSTICYTMTKKGGIIRTETEMAEAIELVGDSANMLKSAQLTEIEEYETLNIAQVGLEILRGAMARKKSVGAHYRSDSI